MATDTAHQLQLYVRRAAQLLRSNGLLPDSAPERQDLDGKALEELFDRGYKQVAALQADIEAHTGCTLDGRRALDYGCGVGRLALPLAERCEHVYGLDVSMPALAAAERNAKRLSRTNVEWLEAGRLEELSGTYDFVVSVWVFQHIPWREGERIFATLLRGLQPGGVGAIHVALRPSGNRFELRRRLSWEYAYTRMNSYSLNRLGMLLADVGVTDWHVRWHKRITLELTRRSYPNATIIFRKP